MHPKRLNVSLAAIEPSNQQVSVDNDGVAARRQLCQLLKQLPVLYRLLDQRIQLLPSSLRRR